MSWVDVLKYFVLFGLCCSLLALLMIVASTSIVDDLIKRDREKGKHP